MKNLILVLASSASLMTFAATKSTQADLFSCTGENGTTVNYSTTSFAGRPTMQVSVNGEVVKATDLKQLQSPVGLLATVTDNHMVPVDGPSVRYTLIVPSVVLADNVSRAEFKTSLIRTSVANRLFGPRNYSGPVENNQVETLNCEASFVVF